MKNRRLFIFVAALAAVALFMLYYAAVAPAVVNAERAAATFAADVKEALGLDVSYARASFTLLPRPAVKLQEVAVASAGKEIIRCGELNLGLSYLGFLTLKPSVATVELVKPLADLTASDLSFGEEGKGKSFRGTVIITDGFLRYEGAERAAFLDGLNGRLRCKAAWGKELELRGKLAADRLSFGAAKSEATGGMTVAAEGKIRYRPEPPEGGRVFFDQLDFLFEGARLSCRGELATGPGERDVDLTFKGAKMALARVLSALAPERFAEAEIEGELAVDLKVKGKRGGGARPDVRGTLAIDKGALSPPDGGGVTAVVGRVRFEGERYVVESLQGNSAAGGFKGYGQVTPASGWPYDFKIEGAVPLETLALVLGVPESYRLRGPVNLNLDLTGELGNAAATSADGTCELAGCQLLLAPFVAPFNDLRGTLYCDGYKIQAGKVRGRLGGGDFEVGGKWEGYQQPRVDVVIVGGDVDLDAALPRPEVKTGPGRGAPKAPGLPGKNHAVKGSVRLKSCKLFKVAAKKPEADFNYEGGILNITKLNFDAYDGKVQAQMTVYPGARPKYTCSVTVAKARLGVFLTDNKWLEDVITGQFNADVVFSAEGTKFDDVKKTFGGKGTLELGGGRVAKLPLLVELAKWSRIDRFDPLQVTKAWTLVEAREGVIRSSQFKLENPDLTAEVGGEVTLDKQLNLTVKVTFNKVAAEAIARDGKALAFVRDADGHGHFNFLVTGDASKPAFQLDAGSMMGQTAPGPTGAGTALVGETGEIF